MKPVFELVEEENRGCPRIKVIGVGGAGCNAIANMIRNQLKGVEFIVANTDYNSLKLNPASYKIQLGKKLTQGWGAGGNPEIGKLAAEESEKEIRDILKDADMVFIAAGLGGGTGTGASPVIASICKEMGVLSVAVVTKPFSFERNRIKIAEEGLNELKKQVNTMIVISNDKLMCIGATEKIMNMFKKADDVLYYAVRGISELILNPGYINLDFADVKAVMEGSGALALMGLGEAEGENRAEEALKTAINNPLLEDVSINRAKGVLINITGSSNNITTEEVVKITTGITNELHERDAKIYWGLSFDDSLGDALRVTVIAVGVEEEAEEEGDVLSFKEEVKKIEEKKKRISLESIDEEELEIPTFLRKNAD
jgi:cell division protein FtsZ